MDKSTQRDLIEVQEQWPIPHIMDCLLAALRGVGPALAFGATSQQFVDPEIAVVIPTSGSTGLSKEVALSARALLASAEASRARIGGKSGQRWSLLLQLNHIAGVNVLVRSLNLGTIPLDYRTSQKYSPAEFTAIVPTQLHRAIHTDPALLEHLQLAEKVLVGGAAAEIDLIAAARNLGINVVTTYGMSETCGGCVYDRVPLSGVELRTSSNGNIELKGAMTASGYLNAPELWDEVFHDGWFTSSDLGSIENGVLTVLGRSDDQIISGGEKISLAKVESEAHSLFPNQQFIAIAIPDAEWGQKLILVSNQTIEMETLKSQLRNSLGVHTIPKEFHRIETLPRTSIDKPDRIQLQRMINEATRQKEQE